MFLGLVAWLYVWNYIFNPQGSTGLPAHIKALKNCEEELAVVDYNAVKRLLVKLELLKDETIYDSFDQLITEMITERCPEDFLYSSVKY